MADQPTAEEQEILQVLMTAARQFDDGATLDVSPPTTERGYLLTMTPHSNESAPLSAHVNDGRAVSFTVGRGLHWEVLQGRRDREGFRAFLAAIVQAVGEGRVKETVWLVGDAVVRAKGTVELEDGRRHRIFYGGIWPLRRGKPASISYRAY